MNMTVDRPKKKKLTKKKPKSKRRHSDVSSTPAPIQRKRSKGTDPDPDPVNDDLIVIRDNDGGADSEEEKADGKKASKWCQKNFSPLLRDHLEGMKPFVRRYYLLENVYVYTGAGRKCLSYAAIWEMWARSEYALPGALKLYLSVAASEGPALEMACMYVSNLLFFLCVVSH